MTSGFGISKEDRELLAPLKIDYMIHPCALWRVAGGWGPHQIWVWRRTGPTAGFFTGEEEWAVGVNNWSNATKFKTREEMLAEVMALKLQYGL
jgi:hypothetical protein